MQNNCLNVWYLININYLCNGFEAVFKSSEFRTDTQLDKEGQNIMATLYKTIEGNDYYFRFYMADKNDVYGNPRIIVHYLDFLTTSEVFNLPHDEEMALAERRAKKAGFRRFKSREFGGGFIRQYDYNNCKQISEKILAAMLSVD